MLENCRKNYNFDDYRSNYDINYCRPTTSLNYKDKDKNLNVNIDSSHVACVGAGIVIGAAAGIYIYKKFFSN